MILTTLVSAPTVAIVILVLVSSFTYLFTRKDKSMERKSKRQARVSQINIFPVKSLGGFSVTEWKLDEYGFELDRHFMIVKANNHKFITQRELPKIALIHASFSSDLKHLILSASGCNDFTLPTDVNGKNSKYIVGIWKNEVEALDSGDDVAKWLTDFLGQEVRLVRTLKEHKRSIPNDHIQPFLEQTPSPVNNVAFADAFPLLLAATESLNDLNKRIKQQFGSKTESIEMKRFRPNIVVSDTKRAYEEDEWRNIRIGSLVMYNVKPCTRCTVPNINPENGTKDISVNQVLASYRQDKVLDNPIFAINVTHTKDSVGKTIRIGDEVFVDSWQKPRELKRIG